MSMETINILCATDNNYAPYCGIMLTSLFESNNDCTFSVYVLVNGDFSSQNKRKYKMLEKKYQNKVSLVEVDESLFQKLPMASEGSHSYITSPTYYRLMASSILPKEAKKCIYLDCDIIVCGDIKPLWNIGLAGYAVAGVQDCSSEIHQQRIGYPADYDYINAGVCVYNLDYWRENNVQERLFEYVYAHNGQLPLMDQDTINGLLYDKTLVVPQRYNAQALYFQRKFWDSYDDSYREKLVKECCSAVIVHYCTRLKPWHFRYAGGFCYALWNYYRKHSLWRNCSIRKPMGKYVKYLVKRFMFPSVLNDQIKDQWVVLPETMGMFGFRVGESSG